MPLFKLKKKKILKIQALPDMFKIKELKNKYKW